MNGFRIGVVFLSFFFTVASQAQINETFKGNTSLTWEEAIHNYQVLANEYENAHLFEVGFTDSGRPLHVFILGEADFEHASESEKVRMFINNGIHPGEPCGIDASVRLARNILQDKELSSHLERVNLYFVPVYNVGGALNRSCCSRANQNGPEEYGFRGNARNLDLNRDFIKCDSENARSFTKLFRSIEPHVFIDTHTSNGADYQYVMTMITTQTDKATQVLGDYMREEMDPVIYEMMRNSDYEMSPYVNSMGRTPEKGISGFMDSPRYSTGYTSLFNSIGYTSETHMFKPFSERVASTYFFLKSVLLYLSENDENIKVLKKSADDFAKNQKEFVLRWELDTTQFKEIDFKGYEAEFLNSQVTGKERLSYNRSKPYNKKIRHYDHYKPLKTISAPEYYLVPQAWAEAVDRLKLNQIKMFRLKEDAVLDGEIYYIDDFKSTSRPYEGHFLHHSVVVKSVRSDFRAFKGDYVIPVNQASNRYIVECLEPESVDSYFSWNFFDSMLQQKEWFSDYIFEDTAIDLLEAHPEIQEEFEKKKSDDEEFANDHWAQLYFLYRKSENFELTYNRYPISRVNVIDKNLLEP